MKRLSWGVVAVAIPVVFLGCQQLQDPGSLATTHQQEKASEQGIYPHVAGWGSAHMGQMLKANSASEMSRQCTICHKGPKQAKMLNISCGSNCHGKNTGTVVKPGLSQPPSVTEGDCTLCHGTKALRPVVHGPVAEKDGCSNCHNPHDGNYKERLVAQEPELCLMCHESEITTAEGRVIPNMREKVENSASVHPVATECSSCHVPHSSDHERLLNSKYERRLRAEYPAGTQGTETFALCFQCHDPALLDSEIGAESTRFRNDSLTGGQLTRKNLHRVHVLYSRPGEGKAVFRSCRICHDPHGSALPAMLGTNVKGFTQTDTGATCTKSCHGTTADKAKSYQRLD